MNDGDIEPSVECNLPYGDYRFTNGNFSLVTKRAFRTHGKPVLSHNVLALK